MSHYSVSGGLWAVWNGKGKLVKLVYYNLQAISTEAEITISLWLYPLSFSILSYLSQLSDKTGDYKTGDAMK